MAELIPMTISDVQLENGANQVKVIVNLENYREKMESQTNMFLVVHLDIPIIENNISKRTVIDLREGFLLTEEFREKEKAELSFYLKEEFDREKEVLASVDLLMYKKM